jgi:outer membrane protein assembly factor BamD
MRSSLLAPLAIVATLLLGSCGSAPTNDETAKWSAQRLFGEAMDSMASKDWEIAIKYFEKLEARFPYGRYAEQAQIEIAYAQWKNGDRASAVASADRFIKLYPNHPNVDYAYYLKGLANFNENTGLLSGLSNPDMSERDPKGTHDAFVAFKELVTRFPDSKYTPDALARMRYLVNSLASHEVHVARWYMRRGAYIAAANRAQYAVKEFPQAPATEEAIFIMIKAYDALGLDDLRDAANRVMHVNFPNSRYFNPGATRKDVPWWRLWDPDW